MRSIKAIGLVVTAVLALSAVAASTASAEKFIASKTGKITGKALNTQIFTAKSGGAKVECTSALPEGEVTKLETEEQAVEVSYSGCKVFGLGAATISKAFYTFIFNIPLTKWSVSILRVIDILVTTFPKCHILVLLGQLRDKTLTFKNTTNSTTKKNTIIAESKVTEIESEVTESESTSLCGTVGEKSATGEYTGNVESEVEGAGNNVEVK